MIDTDTYKVLKLISGENIICELTEDDGKYGISKPLLMHVHPQMTKMGMTESLMLSRWVQPFTDQDCFEIDPKHVIIVLPASSDLSLYYKGVLNKIESSKEQISTMNVLDEKDIYDEFLEDSEPETKLIH